jgi:PAS domain S-box-containing protein
MMPKRHQGKEQQRTSTWDAITVYTRRTQQGVITVARPNANPDRSASTHFATLTELADALSQGNLAARLQDGPRFGELGAAELNAFVERVTARMFWYEAMLDAIPFPLSVTDSEMNWTFVNRAAAQVTGHARDKVIGKQCSSWGADICKTDRCGIALLKRGTPHSFFRQPGLDRDFRVDASYLEDAQGKRIGHIEVVQDVTEQTELRLDAERRAKAEADAAVALRTDVDALLKVVAAAANGDLTAPLPPAEAGVVGLMARALGDFFARLRNELRQLAEAADTLEAQSRELVKSSEDLFRHSEDTSREALSASSASEEVERSVTTVAASVEQMSSSIREIASNASQAATVARGAVTTSDGAKSTMNRLGVSSREVSKVAELISGIAQQTNLLALNARIEAARAGEAGRGFAVVAGEVKDLARQTAGATQDISGRVEQIQTDSGNAAEALSQISGVVNHISEFQQIIAAAVEQQTATVEQIAQSLSQAALGTGEIARNVTLVASAAQGTSAIAEKAHHTAVQVKVVAADLTKLVSRFRT